LGYLNSEPLGRTGRLRPWRGQLRCTPARRCHTTRLGGRHASIHQHSGQRRPIAAGARAPLHGDAQLGGHVRLGGRVACQARGALGAHLGEKGKFMFTASPGLSVFARFTAQELLDCLQLLHGCSSMMRAGATTTSTARGDGQRSFRQPSLRTSWFFYAGRDVTACIQGQWPT
jgi:hypothetical protein